MLSLWLVIRKLEGGRETSIYSSVLLSVYTTQCGRYNILVLLLFCVAIFTVAWGFCLWAYFIDLICLSLFQLLLVYRIWSFIISFFVHSAKSYKIEYILTKESIAACIVYLDSYKSVEMSISFYRKLFSSMLTIPYLSSLTNAVQYMWT